MIKRQSHVRTSESKVSKPIDQVWLWFRSPRDKVPARMMRTSGPPHLFAGARWLCRNEICLNERNASAPYGHRPGRPDFYFRLSLGDRAAVHRHLSAGTADHADGARRQRGADALHAVDLLYRLWRRPVAVRAADRPLRA